MSKREPIDLTALTKLTADEAAPMPEAVQRTSAHRRMTNRAGE